MNLFDMLAEPFSPEDVHWLPAATNADKTKAMACAYIDARAVMDRLDEAVGPANWRDEYMILQDGCVECRLSLRLYLAPVAEPTKFEWITKVDIGTPGGADAGDRLKGAYSDALKRAAVKWGIGRYLYSLDKPWLPINKYKQFETKPKLPSWALPSSVGPERGKELFDLCKKAGVEPSSIIDKYQVADFNLIPANKYQILKDWLVKKSQKSGSEVKS